MNGIAPRVTSSYAAELASAAVARRYERRAVAPEETSDGRHRAFRVPAGESGHANLRAPNAASALIRLISFERGHLSSHARRIVAGGGAVRSQSVDIKVGVAPNGDVIPLGGAAETVFASGDGSGTGSVTELAYAGELRRILAAPGSAYLPFPRRVFPRVVANADTVLNAVQIESDIRELGARLPAGLLRTMRQFAPAVLRRRLIELSEVAGALGGLRDALSPLAERRGLLASTVSVSGAGVLSARATGVAEPGEHAVVVLRTAQGQSVESGSALAESPGVAGTFRVNGAEVTVAASDTVYDIVRLVNRGEDLDLNGVLDPGEDLNGDFELSGGTARHGVRSSYVDGRLRLTAEPGGSSAGRIVVEDPDGVLEALGLAGPAGDFTRVLAARREALMEVDGAEVTSATNTVTGALPGIELTLEGAGEADLVVERDTGAALDLVRDLVEGYNAAVAVLNRTLSPGKGSLAAEGVALRAREAVVGGVNAPVAELDEASDEAADLGIERVRTAKVTFYEETVASVLRQVREFLLRPPTLAAEGAKSVGGSLGEVGIVADDNDTLRLDETAFRRALERDPSAAADLFARRGDRDDMADSGIAVRTGRYLERQLDPGSGSFAMRSAVLNRLIGRQAAVTFAERMAASLGPAALSVLA